MTFNCLCPSGLGNGLQNRLRGFNSHQAVCDIIVKGFRKEVINMDPIFWLLIILVILAIIYVARRV